jgi:hypothetical protein
MCCFDGVGTSCLPLTSSSRPPTKKSDSAVESFLETIDPERGIMLTQVSTKDGSGSSSTNLLFQCPANNASNPGCASNCVNDLNCHVRSQFLRCCPFGCGRTCQFGEELTTCVHWLASNLIEVDKIGLQATGSLGRPTVLCSREGLFEEIQCDVLARFLCLSLKINYTFAYRKCWCVEKSSGIEVPGTRMLYSRLEEIGAENRRPNCREPRVCRMHCPQSDCEHGIKLDASGCSPAQCECRNPCDVSFSHLSRYFRRNTTNLGV